MYNYEELEEEYRGYKIYLGMEEDTSLFDPREWDNLGKMVCFHNRYILGDKKTEWYEENPDYFKLFIGGELGKEYPDEAEYYGIPEIGVALPLYLYDHSGITMNCGGYAQYDSYGWDWGCVGYIYVTKERLLEEYGRQRLTKKLVERATELLRSEVNQYASYLEGDIGYWRVENEDGETVEMLGGYLDTYASKKDMIAEARSTIDHVIARLEQPKWEALATQEV